MKRKGLFKRSLAFLLTSVMTIGLVSYMPNDVTKVQAEETKSKSTIMLGTSGIGNPTEPKGDNGWTGSYVYFGTYNNSPVKYRVLAKETTDFSEEKDGSKPKTMLLDSDSILEKRVFDSNSNVWGNSDIKKYLNSEGDYAEDKKGFLKSSFSALEQAAIAESATSASEEKTNGKFEYANLNGEKIFLLDVKEATNTSYGYSNDNTRKKTGDSTKWWLRSPSLGNTNFTGYVNPYGIIQSDYYSATVGVSPALNIKLSSVLFSSEISANSGEYKLTLIDDKLQIALDGDVERSVDSTDGDTIKVPYSISGDNRNNVTQISMLITDKEYAPSNANGAQKVYYGAMKNVSQTSGENENKGTAKIKLTSELSANITNYHVYIIAEDVNGEKETDYASAPVEITFSTNEPVTPDADDSNNSSSNTDTGSTSTETTTTETTTTETTVEPAPITITYTVKKDDYMRKIAREHGITLEQLIALNPQIKNPNLIYAGQVLVISTTGSTYATTEITATKTYSVQRGDSLYKIARKNGMTLAELKSLNENLFAQKYIYAGQQVLLK